MLIHHVEPFNVPHDALVPLHGIVAMLGEPFVHVKEEELLGPEHTGHGLAQDASLILADMRRGDLAIELVCLILAGFQGGGKAAEGIADAGWRPHR